MSTIEHHEQMRAKHETTARALYAIGKWILADKHEAAAHAHEKAVKRLTAGRMDIAMHYCAGADRMSERLAAQDPSNAGEPKNA